ncbi:VOC family protein [Methylomonas sp. MgM2]
MQCLLDHIVLNVEDDKKMLAFYLEVLMLEPERVEEYKAGKVSFPSVRLNSNTVIDLFPKAPSAGDKQAIQPNLNHFCLTLDKADWLELVQRLESNNLVIDEGPVVRWGAQGSGTSIYFRDPEANVIEARYYDDLSG